MLPPHPANASYRHDGLALRSRLTVSDVRAVKDKSKGRDAPVVQSGVNLPRNQHRLHEPLGFLRCRAVDVECGNSDFVVDDQVELARGQVLGGGLSYVISPAASTR
jgi:hypothetical protein